MVDHPYSLTVYRPFNLNPIINFEKMGDFPTLKKGKSEKSGCLPPKQSGQLLHYIVSSSCPRKSQVAPSKSLLRVQINGAIDSCFLPF